MGVFHSSYVGCLSFNVFLFYLSIDSFGSKIQNCSLRMFAELGEIVMKSIPSTL